MTSVSEQLTARFYEWERRGRGWYPFAMPVELEPPFHPFYHHIPAPKHPIDDGRKSTLLSDIADIFRTKKQEEIEEPNPVYDLPEINPYLFQCDENIVVYKVAMPKGHDREASDIHGLLVMLSGCVFPVSFEITATDRSIHTQFACRKSDAENVYEQIKGYFPEAVATAYDKGRDILEDHRDTCVIDFGLSDEFMRPLRLADNLEQDPYIGLFATLERIASGEQAVIQVLFQGAVNPWADSILRSVSDNKGGSFFADAPNMVKLAAEKVSAPLYGVAIRVAGQGGTKERAIEIAKNVSAALIRLTRSESNALCIMSEEGYPQEDKLDDVFLRETHRLGMLLNSMELATLVHFPTPEVASPKVERDTKKTKQAPEGTEGHPFVLGVNQHNGRAQLVSVPTGLRLRHTHLIGATGTGKSTLLLSMIAQDMKQGNGLAVLDPHGDLIESVLAYIPLDRLDDVIVIDPADGEYPVAFNILSAHSEIEKDILSSDLVAAFKRLSTSWGDQMNSVFANAILAFLESPQGGTLLDVRRFLIEKGFREAYLKTVTDPHIVYYWQHEYPLLKSSSLGSILTRLDTFLRPKLIRKMVAQKKGLDFENILDTKKILLVKLSQGLIGTENSYLLGTFFVSKMYQAAMARQAKSKTERPDFFLYIDEFQNFITPSMSHILSGARKYHLGLILAHQDMQQLQKYDTELASSVVVNAATRICFRLGDTDAKRFASGFSYFDASDLENLRTGEAIGRMEQPNFDFNLSTIPLTEVDSNTATTIRNAAIQRSREKYGSDRATVEKETEYVGSKQETTETAAIPVKPEVAKKKSEQSQASETLPAKSSMDAKTRKMIETQHRYLQMLIKKLAEARGYKAVIEELTPDGKGRVDVSLERDGKRTACEVSVTTSDAWETHNIEKCLAAGYDEVIVCSDNAKTLEKVRQQVRSKFDEATRAKVFAFESHEVMQYFDKQIVQEVKTEQVIRGYRVHVEFKQ